MPTVDELRAKITPYGPWHMVPPTTQPEECRSCGVYVFWIVTPKEKPLPIDCDVRGGSRPAKASAKRWGLGVSHFATCPDAKLWSKR